MIFVKASVELNFVKIAFMSCNAFIEKVWKNLGILFPEFEFEIQSFFHGNNFAGLEISTKYSANS
jgi:hypothetical protein